MPADLTHQKKDIKLDGRNGCKRLKSLLVNPSEAADSPERRAFFNFKIKVMENLEKDVYVMVHNTGGSYTTHPQAAKYGMVAYHFWSGRPRADAGDVLRVVKTVRVNDWEDCYILRDRAGVEYLIATRSCRQINLK